MVMAQMQICANSNLEIGSVIPAHNKKIQFYLVALLLHSIRSLLETVAAF